MDLNANFEERIVVHSDQLEWTPSPMPGVDRRMLDRIGGEVARATTIVRFAANSQFSDHTHAGGEEFIVLDGIFQDQYGDFPAGTYVRNPPTTSHAPKSEKGCTVFVKLWQFDGDDRNQFRKNMQDELTTPVNGVATAELHRDNREIVRYSHLSANATLDVSDTGGLEMLVLDGSLTENGETLSKGAWLRLPQGSALHATAGQKGARIWFKTGHLRHVQRPTV